MKASPDITSILSTQITLTRERLAELVSQRRNRDVLRRKKKRDGRKYYTASKYGLVFSQRILKNASFKIIAERLDTTLFKATEMYSRILYTYERRQQVPTLHRAEGDTWLATNCYCHFSRSYRTDGHYDQKPNTHEGAIRLSGWELLPVTSLPAGIAYKDKQADRLREWQKRLPSFR